MSCIRIYLTDSLYPFSKPLKTSRTWLIGQKITAQTRMILHFCHKLFRAILKIIARYHCLGSCGGRIVQCLDYEIYGIKDRSGKSNSCICHLLIVFNICKLLRNSMIDKDWDAFLLCFLTYILRTCAHEKKQKCQREEVRSYHR